MQNAVLSVSCWWWGKKQEVIVEKFALSGNNNFIAVFDFGKYFSSYDDFLKNAVVSLCGSGTTGRTVRNTGGYLVYNGEEHLVDVARKTVTGTRIQITHYQQEAIGNISNFILIYK